jgi:single-strand DNA-binding protein
MNSVNLTGSLGGDPELRFTPSGKAVCDFRLAIDSGPSDNGPDWVTVTGWGKDAETVAAHKRQGDQVAITGRLTFQTWENEGQRRSMVKVTAEPRGVEFLARRRNDTDHTE